MSEAMKADEMVDYVLGQVDGADRERLERALRDDGEQTARVEHLRQAIYRLLDDGTSFEHPPDLSHRTVAFVARNRRRPSLADYIPVRVPFRWADFAVAAGIFIAGVLTLLPAVQRSRERMNQAGCVFNLQQLGNSFGQYASMNQLRPYPPPHQADAPAGSFASMLHDAGVLNDPTLLDCPCNGPCPHTDRELVGFNDLEHIRKTDRARFERMVKFDYAYNIGYRHASQHPDPLEIQRTSRIPVLADQPDHDGLRIKDGNSLNHGGRGQNVLFGDGSVRWFRTRHVGPHDLDLYLNNDEHLPRPGVKADDSVLVPSHTPFRGW
jgi:prepilin-type processing-associated H-X9-DG protein